MEVDPSKSPLELGPFVVGLGQIPARTAVDAPQTQRYTRVTEEPLVLTAMRNDDKFAAALKALLWFRG